jgi:acyl-coenzyme A synthetase/AMP-(fatty) acid ligase
VRLSGEPADQAILDRLRSVYPSARICHAFASTEAGVAFDVRDGLAGFPEDWLDRDGPVSLRVTDGTLRIRARGQALRYLGDAGAIADADGFVDTRDLVVARGGRLHFAGRIDGVINVGGLKVNPLEVEEVVNAHPRVAQARVGARRSPIIGQVIVAEVVARDAEAGTAGLEADILALCRRSLASHKVPAMVRFVAAIEVNAAGKVVRTAA